MKQVTKENAPILEALCLMWNQYCPPDVGHQYMTAGEATEVVLQDYGLLDGNGGEAHEELLTEALKAE
jgi:hypothetical protein